MKTLYALVFLSVVALATSQSYGELALKDTPPLYDEAIALLPTLNSSTMPTDVQPLRKAILYCRDFLDIFVYAYPNETYSNGKWRDVWIKFREDLDDGYTIIGNFQDLAHSGVHYNNKVLKQRRDDCLDWQKSFSSNLKKYDYAFYVKNASETELYFRDSGDLSAFYWAYVGVYPNIEMTGLQNIATLQGGLAQRGENLFPGVQNMTDLTVEENGNRMHDYRKLVRSILTVNSYFPVMKQSVCVKVAIVTLSQLYDTFGDINDDIVAYQYYVKNKDTKDADKKKADINQAWAQTQTWFLSARIPDQLQCIVENVILN